MDNALLKKDNVILGLRKKLEKNTEDDRYSQYYEKEIIVIEPTCAVNQIHDELLLYKQIYENLSTHIQDNKESISRYESVINELQNEIVKLSTKLKLQEITANRDNKHKEEKKFQRSISTETQNRQISPGKFKLQVNLAKLRDKLKLEEEESSSFRTFNFSEEWKEIIKVAGLLPEELDKLAKNKTMTKVVDAIEILNRLLCDKNLQIRVLQKENENLNKKNFELNKENISLFQQLMELKNHFQKIFKENINNEILETSIINSTNKITFNNIKINSLNQIQNCEQNKAKTEKQDTNSETVNVIDPAEKLKNDLYNNYKEVLFNHKVSYQDTFSDAGEFNNTIEYKKNFKQTSDLQNFINDKNNDSLIERKTDTKLIKNLQIKDPPESLNNLKNKLSIITSAYRSTQSEAKDLKTGTLDSCTLSEFKSGLIGNEASFMSQNDEFENLEIQIKNSNV